MIVKQLSNNVIALLGNFYNITSGVLPHDGPKGSETGASGMYLNVLLGTSEN
jgi:hypothetical protein